MIERLFLDDKEHPALCFVRLSVVFRGHSVKVGIMGRVTVKQQTCKQCLQEKAEVEMKEFWIMYLFSLKVYVLSYM